MKLLGPVQGKDDSKNLTTDILTWVGEIGTNVTDNQTTLQTWREILEAENLTNATTMVEDWQTYPEEIGIRYWIRNGTRIKTGQCNWVHPNSETPRWYCTKACVLWPGQETKGYWKSEVVYPAHHKNETCTRILPSDGMFWGYYNFTCDIPPPPTAQPPPMVTKTSRNVTQGPTTIVAETGSVSATLTPAPGVSTTTQKATIQLVDPNFRPRSNHRRRHQWDVIKACVTNKFLTLNPCYWSMLADCKTQNYLVITPATHLMFYVTKGMYGAEPRAHHENWLNDTLPWLWIVPVKHFRGAFPKGYARTGQGLAGPTETDMYVQRLPTPPELMGVPRGDFQKIDQCVVKKVAQALDGEEYVSNGASPRCPLWQEWNRYYGTWTYNCSGLTANNTVKGILQAWSEGHTRSESSTWWGLQKQEIQEWVVPCLSQTSNYWVKYQYLATVYSKERDIWPGVWSKPEPYVSPRPWRMVCDRANTT
ncbi:uncharacterized protein LOC127534725 [Acanthochromis polyacanthus]|uniref:uncharacterized protein LOC127534725 n=1 Tax=Acanthochromis polyacanthus TaxID=80966 RepID=UPI00223404C6|nr:uncharacterized protein LOC127534725 [Acanthochromis polyacanthus]